MLKLYAIDIASRPEFRGLWCPGATDWPSDQQTAELPKNGHAVPAGFWIYMEKDSINSQATAFELFVNEKAYSSKDILAKNSNQLCQSTSINAYKTKDEVMIIVGPSFAHVKAKNATWEMLNDSILISITQYWRFSLINDQLNQLSDLAYKDLEKAGIPNLNSWFHSKRFMATDLALRKISQDMPFFQGPLIAPYRYLKSDYEVDVYLELMENLDVFSWIEQIDFQQETIHDAYESFTERLFHYKSFALEILFEFIIILILLFNIIYFIH